MPNLPVAPELVQANATPRMGKLLKLLPGGKEALVGYYRLGGSPEGCARGARLDWRETLNFLGQVFSDPLAANAQVSRPAWPQQRARALDLSTGRPSKSDRPIETMEDKAGPTANRHFSTGASGTIGPVEVTFSRRDDGQVDAVIGPGLPVFQEALHDSVSSLPPRGAPGNGPSTYWIDHAYDGARKAHNGGDEHPFTWGNATLLYVRGDVVFAKYNYDEEDELVDSMPLADFLSLLEEWRRRVIQAAATAEEPLPETYRRNPIL